MWFRALEELLTSFETLASWPVSELPLSRDSSSDGCCIEEWLLVLEDRERLMSAIELLKVYQQLRLRLASPRCESVLRPPIRSPIASAFRSPQPRVPPNTPLKLESR